ncbi:Transposon Tf2-1 polyprotein [Ceratobasidium sp. AG-Ba]|nr:Transposon Tf2-1 polyprotein [Ceratobasidium sp. AG-Ba]
MRKGEDLLLCIPNVKIGERLAREVVITHAHSILAHLGARKTLQWLRTQVWWKSMVKDVTDYCESCHICAANKASTQSPMGLIRPMPVPSYPWQSIGIDFVGPLPESETRYGKFDMITTVVDNLTRMIHLIATRQTDTAKDIAEIIFAHVYKLHGMPESIISDRDSLFTSTFWTRLAELTKTELKMSSSYHPQTDGMTERAQRTYTSLLRICAGARQTEWAEHLPAIEFAVNSARSEATGLSPFYLNYGRTPSPIVTSTNSKFPGVREHIKRIKIAIMTAHDAILDARIKMTKQANQHRRPVDIEEGDLVYVSTKHMRMPKGFARKLAPKYVGPYRVERVVTPGASYKIELPEELKARGVRPVFHASLLRYHVPVDDRRFPGREFNQIATLGDAPQEWAVDRITSHKGKGRDAIFEILWKTGDRTWEPYRTVRHLAALDSYCEAQGVTHANKLTAKPGDEYFDGEPEELELNHISLIQTKKRCIKASTTHAENPPAPPVITTYPSNHTLNRTMPGFSTEDVTSILRVQGDTMAQLVCAMNGERPEPIPKPPPPPRLSHRQRDAIRRDAAKAERKPYHKNKKNKKGKKERKTHRDEGAGPTLESSNALIDLAGDWAGNTFDRTGGDVLIAEGIAAIPGTAQDMLGMAYVPNNAQNTDVPTLPTQVHLAEPTNTTQPSILPAQNLPGPPIPPNIHTEQQEPAQPTQSLFTPPRPTTQGADMEVDFEVDYEEVPAEGGA